MSEIPEPSAEEMTMDASAIYEGSQHAAIPGYRPWVRRAYHAEKERAALREWKARAAVHLSSLHMLGHPNDCPPDCALAALLREPA